MKLWSKFRGLAPETQVTASIASLAFLFSAFQFFFPTWADLSPVLQPLGTFLSAQFELSVVKIMCFYLAGSFTPVIVRKFRQQWRKHNAKPTAPTANIEGVPETQCEVYTPPEWFGYTYDEFDDIGWKWQYGEGDIVTAIIPICPKCGCEFTKDYDHSRRIVDFHCPNCDHFQDYYYDYTSRVSKRICHYIETGQFRERAPFEGRFGPAEIAVATFQPPITT